MLALSSFTEAVSRTAVCVLNPASPSLPGSFSDCSRVLSCDSTCRRCARSLRRMAVAVVAEAEAAAIGWRPPPRRRLRPRWARPSPSWRRRWGIWRSARWDSWDYADMLCLLLLQRLFRMGGRVLDTTKSVHMFVPVSTELGGVWTYSGFTVV